MSKKSHTITRVTEVIPTNGRKSSYRKAMCLETADGSHYLKSYDTIMGCESPDGTIHRFSGFLSATTRCHLRAFFGARYREFLKMPVEKRVELSI